MLTNAGPTLLLPAQGGIEAPVLSLVDRGIEGYCSGYLSGVGHGHVNYEHGGFRAKGGGIPASRLGCSSLSRHDSGFRCLYGQGRQEPKLNVIIRS